MVIISRITGIVTLRVVLKPCYPRTGKVIEEVCKLVVGRMFGHKTEDVIRGGGGGGGGCMHSEE